MLCKDPLAGLRFRRAFRTLALVVPLALAACEDSNIAGPQDVRDAELLLSANLSAIDIGLLAVTVTASDIQTLIYNFGVVDGQAGGTIKIPPGVARTVTVQAFDWSGRITHEGIAVINVQPGGNPPLFMTLVPRSGQLEITVTIARFSISVDPGSVVLDSRGSLQLKATIVDVNGQPINGMVEWGSSNPSVASVDGGGLVTAHTPGHATIAVTYEGLAAHAQIVVSDDQGQYAGVYLGPTTIQRLGNPLVGERYFPEAYCPGSACSMYLVVTGPPMEPYTLEFFLPGVRYSFRNNIVDGVVDLSVPGYQIEGLGACDLQWTIDFRSLPNVHGIETVSCPFAPDGPGSTTWEFNVTRQ